MNRGFLARAGMLLGRAMVAFGLGAKASNVATPTGAARLPSHVRLLSPARRSVRLFSPAYRKVKVLGG